MPTPDIEALITHHKVWVDVANNVRAHFVSPPVDTGCWLVIADHGGVDAGGGTAAAGNHKDGEGRCLLPVYYRCSARDGTAASAEFRHTPL